LLLALFSLVFFVDLEYKKLSLHLRIGVGSQAIVVIEVLNL
jgi:hypothetical protein